jgi:hypothetical protein
MTRWEYKTFKFRADDSWHGGVIDEEYLERQLNKLGETGWELVNVVAATAGQGWTRDIVAVLKRPKTIDLPSQIELGSKS